MSILSRVSAVEAPVSTLLPTCASPECQGRRPLWGFWRRHQGIRAQGQWYCSAECFRKAVATSVATLSARRRPRHETPASRMPLGLLLISQGRLCDEQVHEALDAQRRTGGKIGSYLRQSGAITDEDLTRALGQQSGCPVLSLDRVVPLADKVPFWLRRRNRILPVYWSQARDTLWLAFADPVRYAVLTAIEQMLECRCDPCMVNEESLSRALEGIDRQSLRHEAFFRTVVPAEIASIAVSYALQLQADQVRWVECAGDFWMRFTAGQQVSDVGFGPGDSAHLPAPERH